MARRLGFYSLEKTATLLCRYVNQFGPLLKVAFPGSPALAAALDAAYAACQVLTEELDKVAPVGV